MGKASQKLLSNINLARNKAIEIEDKLDILNFKMFENGGKPIQLSESDIQYFKSVFELSSNLHRLMNEIQDALAFDNISVEDMPKCQEQ